MGHELCESRTSLGSELRTLESKLRMTHEPYVESRLYADMSQELYANMRYQQYTDTNHESNEHVTNAEPYAQEQAAYESRTTCGITTIY